MLFSTQTLTLADLYGLEVAVDMLIDAGIKAIWNFAPVHLRVPQGVVVKNENLAVSLALLSKTFKDLNELN